METCSNGHTITSSGFYFITKDLQAPASSHGITIQSSNVTIDLMGFSLVGPRLVGGDYSGIWVDTVQGNDNIEIRNGTIRNFRYCGYYSAKTETEGHRLINIRAIENGNAGISIAGRTSLIKDCTSRENGEWGIFTLGYGTIITGNTCTRNGNQGIYGSMAAAITGNTCTWNTRAGIAGGHSGIIKENTCYYNEDGIYAGRGCTITGNTCSLNTNHGISVQEGSTVIGNTSFENANHGISFAGTYSYVDQNTCYNNGTNMNSCTNCTVGLNLAP